MRKLLIALLILFVLAAGLVAGWIFRGREASLYLDRFRKIEVERERISSVRYEGNGTGGALRINEKSLSLNPSGPLPVPNVGSTKDGQLALAVAGKVFPFGPLPKALEDTEAMTTDVPPEDQAQLSLQHSILPWPTPFDLNFMTGASPSCKRHSYQRLTWKKPNGSELEMLWRYEQDFVGKNGWTSPTMINDKEHTGLIKIEVKP